MPPGRTEGRLGRKLSVRIDQISDQASHGVLRAKIVLIPRDRVPKLVLRVRLYLDKPLLPDLSCVFRKPGRLENRRVQAPRAVGL